MCKWLNSSTYFTVIPVYTTPKAKLYSKRFYQTVKSMIWGHYLKFDADWVEGVHLLFVAWEVVTLIQLHSCSLLNWAFWTIEGKMALECAFSFKHHWACKLENKICTQCIGKAKDCLLHMQKQVTITCNYILHGIAECSSSTKSSHCLVATKCYGSDCFCTHFTKINSVTKPVCSPLPQMEGCIDCVGLASVVGKCHWFLGPYLTHRGCRCYVPSVCQHIHHLIVIFSFLLTCSLVCFILNADWLQKCHYKRNHWLEELRQLHSLQWTFTFF